MIGEPLIIKIGEEKVDGGVVYYYETPPMPQLSTMLNFGLDTKDQKFNRTEIPECFGDLNDLGNTKIIRDEDGNALLNKEQQDFVIQERDRIIDGCWYLIKGKPIYFTGDNYFYLNYWWIGAENEDGYPDFRYADCKYFYFADIVDKDSDVFGGLFVTGRRFGKALCLETDIPTPNGWVKMKDLNLGDMVFGSDGLPTKVTFVSDVMEDRTCYNVKLSDGSIIKADADHNWLVSGRQEKRKNTGGKVLTTQQIVDEGVLKTRHDGKFESRYSIVNAKPVQYEKRELKIPPYILGIWLGDGASDYTKLTNVDQPIIDRWIEYGKSIGLSLKMDGGITYMLTGGRDDNNAVFKGQNTLLNYFREYNLIKNKHIPQDYMISCEEDRMELLRGLFDSDGYVSKNGVTYSITQKRKVLCEQILELASSLGYKATLTEKYVKYCDTTYYIVTFGTRDRTPFTLPRRLEVVKERLKVANGGWRLDHRYIVEIEKCKTVPVKCIQVDNADHTYLCTRNYVVTHNTEKELCRVYRKAITSQNKIFALMSLTKDEAKENLFAKIVRSWDVMFEFFKPKHSGTTRPTESLVFSRPPRSSKKERIKQKEQTFLNNVIGTRSTKIAALQGKKPFYTFLDEGATIDEMDLTKFWSTSKQALALGGGKKIIGKVMMPCTLEEMNPKSGERYYTLWKQSNVNQLTLNGRTSSGLIRYLKPYWEGLEGFIDEYGFDLKEAAIKFVENEYQSFLDKGELDEAVRYRRQFPRNANDAFNIETGTGIEEDCKMILQDVLEKANDGLFPERPCEIYEVDGEVRTRNSKPTKDCLYIIEEPEENTEYVIGIDGTATDKASSGTDPKNKKSDFAIVVTKKLKIGGRSYCEVAYISRIPVNKDDMFRISFLLYKYYNVFGNCKVSPEANAGNISPIFSYFTNRGAKRALIQEPKYVGTDSKEVMSRYGFVRTGKMKEAQIYLLNIQIRLFGHHFRSKRLIENIIKTGVENTDLSDAFQAALVGWGNFGNIEHKEAVNNDRYRQLRANRIFNQQTGQWEKVEVKKSA